MLERDELRVDALVPESGSDNLARQPLADADDGVARPVGDLVDDLNESDRTQSAKLQLPSEDREMTYLSCVQKASQSLAVALNLAEQLL